MECNYMIYPFAAMFGWYLSQYFNQRGWLVVTRSWLALLLFYAIVGVGYGLSWLAAKIFLGV